jgi:hypothetical protein
MLLSKLQIDVRRKKNVEPYSSGRTRVQIYGSAEIINWLQRYELVSHEREFVSTVAYWRHFSFMTTQERPVLKAVLQDQWMRDWEVNLRRSLVGQTRTSQ